MYTYIFITCIPVVENTVKRLHATFQRAILDLFIEMIRGIRRYSVRTFKSIQSIDGIPFLPTLRPWRRDDSARRL